MSDDVLRRIDGWEAAGLLDRATAERLRQAESGPRPGPGDTPSLARVGGPFNPTAMVVEVFSYLGASFILGAWALFINDAAGPEPTGDVVRLVGAAIVAIVTFVVGWTWRRRVGARGRAASAAFLVSAGSVATATTLGLSVVGVDVAASWSATAAVASAAAVAAATAYRLIRPALGTQVGLLIALVGLAGSVFTWARETLFPTFSEPMATGPDVLQAVLALGYWWLVAVGLGALGLAEARSAAPESAVRSAATRVGAGLVAVVGTAMAITLSGPDGERLIPPVIGALILLALSAALLERALRRRAAAFIVPAALGVFIALSDLNGTIAGSSEVGGVQSAFLLVEGLLLLGVAGGAEWFRRRFVAGAGPPAAEEPDPASSVAV
jgi:hypothetical protein